MSVNLKETLNLPQTGFPMRANLVEREPVRLDHWSGIDLYGKLQEKNASGETFLLHDGPPFTNGDVHVGTALNKTLKDVIVRFKSACGYRVPFLPGWDCHGLPIEHKVTKNLRGQEKDFTPLELRRACKEFSQSFIEKQRGQFKRLGVLADWNREYRTMDPDYEAVILRTFAEFVDKGFVYRSKKPVYWSIPCRTALAEAEVEYQDHVSPAIHVKFALKDSGDFAAGENAFVVIWTTTPWTIPANLAIAVNPRETYVEVKSEGNSYWVGASLAEKFAESCELENHELGRELPGKSLVGWIGRHPFIDRDSPVVAADYVTMDAGTGCVHTAPGHGLDDYLTGLANGLDIYCPLDDAGRYLDDGQVPACLVGLSVLERKKGCEANEGVLALLREHGGLLHLEHHSHQYPHCWRSKTPVVFRAMDQWFVSLDKDDIRNTALGALDDVAFTPEWGRNRIRGFLESRPDWCISRQRSWGVPIPVFFDEEGEPLLDAKLIRYFADKVEHGGTDLWFDLSAEELLAGFDLPEAWKGKSLVKGSDTLDVWIDSGCSHRAVLRQKEDLKWPADLYLEGSDQHRGWFQSSLWTALLADGAAPYARILTHGFVVDGEGRKISKSDGKPQTVESYVKRYGADVLRLWICSEDFRRDIPISEEILDQVVRGYRTIRNTFRFQLGNLFDFDRNTDSIPFEQLSAIDLWALDSTADLVEDVTKAFESYEFHRGIQLVNRYCSNVLSAVYHDVLKDRLYTLSPNDPLRRSSQTALDNIFQVLVKLLAPIIPFTSDEAWAYLEEGGDFCLEPLALQDWPKVDSAWRGGEKVKDVSTILAFKTIAVNEALEKLRVEKVIGQSLDAEVEILGHPDNDSFAALSRNEDCLAELFITSRVILKADPNIQGEPTVEVRHASGVRCPRSWRWVPELTHVEPWGEVSSRCAKALSSKVIS